MWMNYQLLKLIMMVILFGSLLILICGFYLAVVISIANILRRRLPGQLLFPLFLMVVSGCVLAYSLLLAVV